MLLQVLLGLLLLSVLMSTLLMTLFDHRYVKPVKSLKNRLAALLTGETTNSQKLSYPNEEFSEIADSIEGLTQSTMNRKAEELSAVLESSNDGILVLDRNDRVLHYNTRLLTLWGLAEKNVYNAYGDLWLDQRVITTEGCSHPSAQVTETQLCYLKIRHDFGALYPHADPAGAHRWDSLRVPGCYRKNTQGRTAAGNRQYRFSDGAEQPALFCVFWRRVSLTGPGRATRYWRC